MQTEATITKRSPYRDTIKAKVTKTWYGLTRRAENESGYYPSYKNVKLLMTREVFVEWYTEQLEKWTGTKSFKDATLDRIKNEGHYEISNLQLLTLKENSIKKRDNRNVYAPTGKAWCGRCKAYYGTENFYKDKHNPHGLCYSCKPCSNNYVKLQRTRKKQENIIL